MWKMFAQRDIDAQIKTGGPLIHMNKSPFTESQIIKPWIKHVNLIGLREALQGLSPYQFAAQNA